MDLQALNSGTITTKGWLNPVCGTITASNLDVQTVVVENIDTKSLTLIKQSSIPNPSVGSVTLYIDQSSGVLASQDSNGDTVPYVPTSGAVGAAAMTGNIDMGENVLFDWSELNGSGDILIGSANASASVVIGATASATPFGNNVAIGGATCNGTNQIAIGSGANLNNAGTYNIAIGRNCNCNGNVGICIGQSSGCNGATSVSIGSVSQCNAPNSVCIGASTTSTTGGDFQIVIGSGSRVSSTTGSGIAIGHQAAIEAGADGSIAIGDMADNNIANSVLLGNTNVVNIRPNSAVCTLGTSADPFRACWLRDGALASGCKYSQYGPVTVANTAVDTSLATGTAMGSLVMSAGQTPGTVIRAKLNATFSQIITDSSIVRVKTNGNPLIAIALGPGAALVTTGLDIQCEIVILGGGNAQCELRGLLTNEPLAIVNATSAWNQAIANTLDFSIQYDEANAGDTITCNFLYVETLFAQ